MIKFEIELKQEHIIGGVIIGIIAPIAGSITMWNILNTLGQYHVIGTGK